MKETNFSSENDQKQIIKLLSLNVQLIFTETTPSFDFPKRKIAEFDNLPMKKLFDEDHQREMISKALTPADATELVSHNFINKRTSILRVLKTFIWKASKLLQISKPSNYQNYNFRMWSLGWENGLFQS